MHEASLAEQVLRAALSEAERKGAVRVTRLRLTVGKMEGLVPAALREAFVFLASDTIAAGAPLEIEETEGRGWTLDSIRVRT